MSIVGVKTKLISEGKSIYKGDNKKYKEHYLKSGSVTLTHGPAFFALDPKVALGYGVVFTFKTTEALQLVKLDDFKTMKAIYDNADSHADETVKRILKTNYGYDDNKETIGNRVSVHAPDRNLSQYLCDNGYDGYILETGKTFAGGTFHPEIMLCDMRNIKFLKKHTPDEDIKGILEEHKNKRLAKELQYKRDEAKRLAKELQYKRDDAKLAAKRARLGIKSDDENGENVPPNFSVFGQKPYSYGSLHSTPTKKMTFDDSSYSSPQRRDRGGTKRKRKNKRKSVKKNSRRKRTKQNKQK